MKRMFRHSNDGENVFTAEFFNQCWSFDNHVWDFSPFWINERTLDSEETKVAWALVVEVVVAVVVVVVVVVVIESIWIG